MFVVFAFYDFDIASHPRLSLAYTLYVIYPYNVRFCTTINFVIIGNLLVFRLSSIFQLSSEWNGSLHDVS